MSSVLLGNHEYLLGEKKWLDCSQRSFQSSCGMYILKNGSSGFQGKQPVTSVRFAHGQKSNVELPCFLMEQDFTPTSSAARPELPREDRRS